MLDYKDVPSWLWAMMSEKFFNACIIHEEAKKNEKNVFCFDCCEGICPHCLLHHRSHRLLQIRRYMYHDVIRLVDADKLMDCAQVQTYTTNSAKVVFLKQRPHSGLSRGPNSGNFCIYCDKTLQDSYLFCSLSCKLQHVLRNGLKLSVYLRKCEFLAIPEPGLDDGQMTPNSVLEPAGSMRTESSSIVTGLSAHLALTSTATTEAVRKKRSHLPGTRSARRPAHGPVSGVHHSETTMNRRKGTPHRSPLY